MSDGDGGGLSAEEANELHWARIRCDAAVHELHLAVVLAGRKRGFQASQLEHLIVLLRQVRDRLR